MMDFLAKYSKYANNPIEEEDQLAEELVGEGKEVIKLNRGDPPVYFPTPEYIINAYISALKQNRTGYATGKGVPELREAVANRYKRMYNTEFDKDDVIVTQGISEALLFLNNALINPGDSAIMFKPHFSAYTPLIEMQGGTRALTDYDEKDEWNVHIGQLEELLKKTKAAGKLKKIKYMIITNPNNPTGTVLRKNILKEVVRLASEYDIMLVSDEIYDEIVYNGAKFTSISELAKGVPHIILNGASKDFAATGFRIGFMIMPESDKKSIQLKNKLTDYARMRLSANTPAQYAMKEALNNIIEHERFITQTVGEIEERVNFAMKILGENPYLDTVKPNGAFYIFPRLDLAKLGFKTDKEFVDKLLKEQDVQLTRGSGFESPGHIRLVSLAPREIMEEAINRINAFCAKAAKK